MSLVISSFFTSTGIPATGLSPTIRIWEVDGASQTLIVGAPNGTGQNVDGAMIEIDDGTSQDGFYKFDFTALLGYDATKNYVFRVDGGAGLAATDRYQAGEADPSTDISNESIADSVWDETAIDHLTPGTMGEKVNQTNANTTQLVLDVAVINDLVDLLLKYETNRTKIDPAAKTLTVYDDDCTTVLRVFNLLDSTGSASVEEVCERVPTNASDGLPVCP